MQIKTDPIHRQPLYNRTRRRGLVLAVFTLGLFAVTVVGVIVAMGGR